MPARFVEIATLTDTALNAETIGYFSRLNARTWALPEWTATNSSRLMHACDKMRAPEGYAQLLIVSALLAMLVQAVIVRVVAKSTVREFGAAVRD